jgi:hypothetical protein
MTDNKNGEFFKGAIIGFFLCIPVWVFLADIAWRW